MLKERYEVVKSVGFIDFGFNYLEEGLSSRFAYVDLDSNKDGVIDPAEAEAVKTNLWTVARNAGAKALIDSKGIAISINHCIDFNGTTAAKDDIAIVLQKGDLIDTTTELSFAQLHWLNDNEYIS